MSIEYQKHRYCERIHGVKIGVGFLEHFLSGSNREDDAYRIFQPGLAPSAGPVPRVVCMYRGRPSWNCPWKGAIQPGQGEGPIGIVGPISQPRGTNGTASLTLERTSAPSCTF